MHARSGAWRCCDDKEWAARVQCELLFGRIFYCPLLNSKSPLICIVGKQQKNHKPRSLNCCYFANQRVLFFAIPFLPYKALCLRTIWRLPSANVCEAARIAKCECLRSRANCQVRMLVKQPNRQLQQLLAVENKTILQQLTVNSLHDVPTHTNFLSTSHWHAFRNALH